MMLLQNRRGIVQKNISCKLTYVKTPLEVSDKQILEQHPAVKIWQDALLWIVKWHPEFSHNESVVKLYNENI